MYMILYIYNWIITVLMLLSLWQNYRQPLAPYQIREIAGCARAGNVGNFFPDTDFKGNR